MRHYVYVMLGLLAFMLALFGLAEALHIPLLTDPTAQMKENTGKAAALGVGLLLVDVVLPVPSSIVMILNGAIFGAAMGAGISLVGSMGAALIGFFLGRRGGRLLERMVPADERARVDRWLQKYGALAIIASRPVPLLAEVTTLAAGASPMRWRSMILSAFAGTLPTCVTYAVAGASAKEDVHGAVIFGGVMVATALFWWIGRKFVKQQPDSSDVSDTTQTPSA